MEKSVGQEWPKYYPKQVILNERKSATVALVTGWTKKEMIWEKLSAKAKAKVAIAGQLYSKEGINFIIRNLFLNPNINYLLITGQDLSGSLKEFENFLKNENLSQEYFHEEIPAEKIKEFVEYFSSHSATVPQKELNDFLEKLNLSETPLEWTPRAVDFAPHLAKPARTFPSEKVAFRIEGEKVVDVWLRVLDRIIKFGFEKMSSYGEKQRELIDTVTVVGNDDPDNPYLPSYVYFTKQDLINYYPQMMTDTVFEGVEYTYGSRLRNRCGINQIQIIIKELKKEYFSRRAVAFTWSVTSDAGNEKAPCFNALQALIQDGQLYLTAYFRSNDMYRAWPQNAFGLLKIQKEIAEALDIKIGKLIIISCSAHIYEHDFVSAQKLIDKHKPKLECGLDPRGNFVIETDNNELLVRHVDAEGMPLQEFRGKTAQELRDQISPFISDPAHAIYMGAELVRAETALKNNEKYYQS